jgi:hypothetical protein
VNDVGFDGSVRGHVDVDPGLLPSATGGGLIQQFATHITSFLFDLFPPPFIMEEEF